MPDDESEYGNMFLDALLPLQRYTLLDTAENTLIGLTKAVDSLQKPGTITLKLTVKPDGQGQMAIFGDLDCKYPKPVLRPATFFLTPEGNMTTNDPQQAHMGDVVDDFKPKPKPVVQHDPKTGEVIE